MITSRLSQSPSLFFRSSRPLSIRFYRKKMEQPGASNTGYSDKG